MIQPLVRVSNVSTVMSMRSLLFSLFVWVACMLLAADAEPVPAWLQVGRALSSPRTSTFGNGLSLSDDGNVVAIGEIDFPDEYAHKTRVFEWDNATASWSQMGMDIIRQESGVIGGSSVSLSSDASTLAVGVIPWDVEGG
jgi:hypothetical protein